MSPSPPAAAHTDGDGDVTLAPRYWVPLGLALVAALVMGATLRWSGALWFGAPLLAFAAFLFLQASILRLCFTADALLVLRNGEEIRRFPYDQWLAWRLWIPALPVLFYFREQGSPHLLPMLFDATALRTQLDQRVPCPVSPRP
ncbi:MAG: DUF3119 family protein [Cyanobacteriota bacterium]|nr:DUF3119 family protein [Cyanobacteriota bacterium]